MAPPREKHHAAPGELISLNDDERKAIQLYAPHLGDVTHGKVISNTMSLVLSIQDKAVIKQGPNLRREVNIMRFVAKRFSIPIPNILGVHLDARGRRFLVMEFIKGQSLQEAWPQLKEEEKERVAMDLKRCVDEMRLVTGTYMGSLNREPFPHGNVMLQYGNSGPFENEDQFNEAILTEFDETFKYHTPVIRQTLKSRSDHRILFAHGDLQEKNIMVHEGRISAIVDWELAGFYPEYWEYAIAWLNLPWCDVKYADWPAYLQKALKPYPVEAATISIIANQIMYGL